MFTGIIEEIGTLRRVYRQGKAMMLTVGARKVLEDVALGDSIAVNGVCLTVVAFDSESFTADVMPETFRQTNLGELASRSRVNLERAMGAKKRFGGHIVQGHVDTTGRITSRIPEENAVVFTVEPEDKDVLRYVLPRGSIAIDGISLTVIRVTEREFAVSIIPHTLAETVLADKGAGEQVNLETDILGKYVERLLTFRKGDEGGSASHNAKKGGLTEAFLAENGFL
ncbi:riboflavin synthase [Gorillibacterium sp. sgz5001074]|uniref:riboflavin synthase n=1 Tax=Gorillibacterium sp. sgz5001074 TaxID=3446695 RepID=UPI003F678EF3